MDDKPTTHEERIAYMRAVGEAFRKAGEDAAAKMGAFVAAWNESVARGRR